MGLGHSSLPDNASEISNALLIAPSAQASFPMMMEVALARAAFNPHAFSFIHDLLRHLVGCCECEAVSYLQKKSGSWSVKNLITAYKNDEGWQLPKLPKELLLTTVTSRAPLLPGPSRQTPGNASRAELLLILPIVHERNCSGALLFYRSQPLLLTEDQIGHLVQISGMIGFHLEAEQSRRQMEERENSLNDTIELAAIGICHVSPEGHFIYTNQQMCDMLGYGKSELQGLSVLKITHEDDKKLTRSVWDNLHAGEIDSFKVEKRYLRKDGSVIWVRLTITLRRDDLGRPVHHISIVEDITERKQAEEQVHYLATHDEMTGLPNRTMFNQILRHAIDAGKRYSKEFSVMFVDLDRFKQINDSLGHEAGDKLLIEVATRLKHCVRSSDVVSRLGGDEFMILLLEVADRGEVAGIARKIINSIIRPFRIKGQDCRVTASIGIATYPEHGTDDVSITKNADSAMYMAKDDGKNNYKFFDNAFQHCAIEKLTLENNIRVAFEKSEFEVHYQAKIDTGSRQVCGAEALMRWPSKTLGNIPPGKFIPVAEEIGLIVPMGKWVIGEVCKQISDWQSQGLPAVRVSINLSPRQFMDQELITDITKILDETGTDPSLLEFEITESMVMHNLERAIAKLRDLKNLGVKIAIDDFGTGYSSLSQLKQFPIDTLKVDRSFIRDLHSNANDQAITTAIISMGKTLGLTVVAEGVETDEQIEFLTDKQCDELQGFYFSKPTDPLRFAQHLKLFLDI